MHTAHSHYCRLLTDCVTAAVQNTSLSYGVFPLRAGSLHLFLFPVSAPVFITVTALAAFLAMLAAGSLVPTAGPV